MNKMFIYNPKTTQQDVDNIYIICYYLNGKYHKMSDETEVKKWKK